MNFFRPSALRTRIKFCGLTRAADVHAAVDCGTDAVGFVWIPESRRCVSLQTAANLRATLPPFVAAVVLLRNPNAEQVREVIEVVRPDILQFHGEEEESFCASFGVPYLKAVAMADLHVPLGTLAQTYASAAALLLDGHASGELGGQGARFDWTRVRDLGKPLILAGGLDADNVAEAIRLARPYAVDVSSGIEKDPKTAPGIKDSGRMAAFARAVARADATLNR